MAAITEEFTQPFFFFGLWVYKSTVGDEQRKAVYMHAVRKGDKKNTKNYKK